MTLKDAKARLREIGITIRKRDGEYRVNFAGGDEATAYYTTDLDDAVGSGLAMHRWQAEQRKVWRLMHS